MGRTRRSRRAKEVSGATVFWVLAGTASFLIVPLLDLDSSHPRSSASDARPNARTADGWNEDMSDEDAREIYELYRHDPSLRGPEDVKAKIRAVVNATHASTR